MLSAQRPNALSVWRTVCVAVDISPLKIRCYLVSRGSMTNQRISSSGGMTTQPRLQRLTARKHLISGTDVAILIRRISITGLDGVDRKAPLKRSPHPLVMTQSLLPSSSLPTVSSADYDDDLHQPQ